MVCEWNMISILEWFGWQCRGCCRVSCIAVALVSQGTPWLSGPVLRDTARLSQRYPPIARYGVFGVSTWPIGCDTPSPFLSVSP